jgi:hypothetical protein
VPVGTEQDGGRSDLDVSAKLGERFKKIAVTGQDVLARKPPKKARPQRRAMIHVARAMRLSEDVFGVAPR